MTKSFLDAANEMDDKTFRRFVAAHLGPEEPPALWAALLGPELFPRTKDALLEVEEQTNDTLSTRKEELRTLQLQSMAEGESALPNYVAAKAEYDDWLRRTTTYRRMIKQRIRELQTAERENRRRAHEEHQARNRDLSRAIATKLTLAIHKHRATSLALDLKPEPHDRELWGLLDELTVEMNNQHLTLSQAIEYGFWRVDDPRDGDASGREDDGGVSES